MILIEMDHSGTATIFLQGHMIWEGAEFESLWGFCESCTVIQLTKGILRQNEIFICSMNNNCWGSRAALFTFQSLWILLCVLPHWADQRTARRRRWYRRALLTSNQTSELRGSCGGSEFTLLLFHSLREEHLPLNLSISLQHTSSLFFTHSKNLIHTQNLVHIQNLIHTQNLVHTQKNLVLNI